LRTAAMPPAIPGVDRGDVVSRNGSLGCRA
jgi:hypothetical protein